MHTQDSVFPLGDANLVIFKQDLDIFVPGFFI